MAKTDKKTGDTPERVWARVTVGMAGARRGQRVLVDPNNPEMAELIAAKMVVLEDVAAPEPEPELENAAAEEESS